MSPTDRPVDGYHAGQISNMHFSIAGVKTRDSLDWAANELVVALKRHIGWHPERESVVSGLLGECERFRNDLTYHGKSMKYSVVGGKVKLRELYWKVSDAVRA